MNCLDCAAQGQDEPAVAICLDCGAGLCVDHAEVEPRWLTRTAAVNRVVAVEPPARAVRCRVCSRAHGAARRPVRRETSGRGLAT